MEKKTCTKCGLEKDITEYSWKSQKLQTKVSACKTCTRKYVKTHYENNKEEYLLRANNHRQRRKKINFGKIAEYFKEHHCVDCGENDLMVLEFDHVSGKKEFTISRHVGDKNWSEIKDEIEKCEVRCANCHRRRTAKQQGWFKYINREKT